LLDARGAEVAYVDPYVAGIAARDWSGARALVSEDLRSLAFASYDCIVIVTNHQVFDYARMIAEADLIVDTRNAVPGNPSNVFKLGAPRPSHADDRVVSA
jgi:UDP-N-acetyl-D-glucosamine dehydrogenase